ncbi:class I adenylate-forming enzyme family protein [Nocardiopsis sp. FIRDI 009]|uniref:class I adenylate-forming enzyme family protein n=1 Tax=Nocardiopsis sp. FIRDI 009 TaxID=714197 RepID=UPI000E2219A1|nr:AMP-binding protein [Nocardiopsis sp. FIRDI 009]
MLNRLLPERAFYLGQLFENAAAKFGSTPVTLDQPLATFPERGRDLTYAALADVVDDLAARLWEAGVRPAERIAVHKSANFDIALIACAAARIGAVPVTLSPALSGQIIDELLRRLDQPWLVTDADKIDGDLADLNLEKLTRRVLVAGTREHPTGLLLAGLDDAPRRDPVRMHPSQPALITHTSGTTGVSKLMVHTAQTIFHRLLPQQIIAWPVRRRERVALCMSFVHSRFFHSLGVFLNYGNPLDILVDPDPDVIGPIFTRTRPGLVETHPNNFIQWEDLVDAPGAPLASVRYYSTTFDAIHPRTIQRLLGASRRRNPLMVQLYGQSETGPISGWWYTPRSAQETDGRCVGFPLPGFIKVRAVGEDGKPVRRGEAGHLEVRSRGRVLTYLGEDGRYRSQLNGSWWRLGDMGYLNRWGMLFLIDRDIDQIDSIDSNLELEDVLMSSLDELLEVVIVKGPDNTPVPIVCTRKDAPLDQDRWRKAVQDMPPMADPLHVPFTDLPRTSTWKVQRVQLTRMLEEGSLRTVDSRTAAR